MSKVVGSKVLDSGFLSSRPRAVFSTVEWTSAEQKLTSLHNFHLGLTANADRDLDSHNILGCPS